MIPLTVRSNYSLMWGTASIKVLCRHARQLGYDRMALTDTDNLYGLWPFLTACRTEGIIPIVGAEVTDPHTPCRAVCLVKNETGYSRLCRLLTQRHMETAHFDLATALPPLAEGLTVLTSNADLLTRWHRAGLRVAAAMPRNPLPSTHRLRQTAGALGVPLVATPGSFFLRPQDHAFHRLLRAIDLNTTLDRLQPRHIAPDDAWLAGPDAYAQRFAVWPQALENTLAIAEEITFTGPRFGLVMPPWPDHRSMPAEALRRAAYAGARKRYGRELPEPVVDRLEHELRIIEQMNFSAYFLLVRDIVQRSPRTCGRGSGAASLVAYCLGITNVCPVKHNLYFGRFLNPGRQDPPDIDVDFAWDERDGVIDGVLNQFGCRAAMVSSHTLFQPRMAVRETAKVFGLTQSEIGNVTKRLPWFWRITSTDSDLMSDLRSRPEAKALEFIHPWPDILSLAQQLIGTPRYLSVHPGGVVITPRPICHYVPVQRAAKGVPIIQWEKDAVEDAGLVKIDLLGNRSLGVIRDAINNVNSNGIQFDETHWEPEDDVDTQAALAHGNTMGCFYIESPAMRLLQQKAGVGDFEHLVIHSSIIRPAANECIQEYLRRLHGGDWKPIHPLLTDVLEETFGIMVYQEDVSLTAMALAGFDDAEADGLRKVMSKKDRALKLQDYYQRFAGGARKRGVTPQQIRSVWQMMMSFSGYSFCKPHSASYAQVSFQAAYLKTHFPAEFMAAVISNRGGFYSTFAYVSEARRLGVTILGPDVHQSQYRWIGGSQKIRVGLMAVKGVDHNTVHRIVERRSQKPFEDLYDFFTRVKPAEDEARALIHCGALDRLAPGHSRAQMAWQWVRWQAQNKSDAVTPSLFDVQQEMPPPPKLPPDDDMTLLRREFKVLGFLCRRHPMTLFARAAKAARTVKAAALARHLGRHVRFAGWLITGKVVRTKSGDPMEFLTFEDETGIVETTFFPKTYDRFCHLIDRGHPYILGGKVEQNWGAATLTVSHVHPLSD